MSRSGPAGPTLTRARSLPAAGGRDRRLDALGAGHAREGRADGQHRAGVQALRHDAHVPQGLRREDAAGLQSRTLGVWFYGNEYPFLSWMDKLGYKTSGEGNAVKVLKQGFNVDPLLQKQADCISTMTYNEYWQLIEAGMKPDELIVFKYEDQGVATLEDGCTRWRSRSRIPRYSTGWRVS